MPIYPRCYTGQRCANRKANQQTGKRDAAWALAHDVRCVDPLSCSKQGSLVDPPSSFRGSVDPTRAVKNNYSTSVGLQWLRTNVTTMKSRDASLEEASFLTAMKMQLAR